MKTRTVKKRSQIQEKGVAKDLKARTVVASGALWNAKADVRNDKFLIECKTTQEDFYSITTKVWEKVCEEADRDGLRIPLLVIDLEDKNRYVVYNPKHFDRQLNTWNYDHKKISKSYRFTGYLKDLPENDLPIMVALVAIKANNGHSLMAMRMSDFLEYYEEELK